MAIALVALLGFHSFGLCFFYLAEIQLCKIKAEEYVDDDRGIGNKKLVIFSPGAKGVELVNKNEISADGKMYDIVKKQTVGGKLLYYALEDNDEDEYVQRLTDLGKNDATEKSLPGLTVKTYEAKYFSAKNNSDIVCLSLDRLPVEQALNRPIRYLNISKAIFSPPPNHLFS